MLYRIIDFSLRYRFIVLLLGLVLVATGVHALIHLPLDAFPDTTPVQVQINTAAPSLGAEEVEQQITLRIERVIGGLPGLDEIRSLSKFGLSQVTVTFHDNVSTYLARQLVHDQLRQVEMPQHIAQPKMGPISSGLGEVYVYLVQRPTPPRMSDEQNLTELRTIQDTMIKPKLKPVLGLADINSWGGFEKQYHVEVDPTRLAKYGLTLADLNEAIAKNNANVGGGVLEQGGETVLLKGIGLVTTVDQIADITVASYEGVPVRVSDVAQVTVGHEIRRGAVTADGKGETVLGLSYMLMGENSREVTHRIDRRMKEIQRTLPEGVTVKPVYKRTELVDQVLTTVRNNLLEGALLVIAVLFAFLGNLRGGLIVASAIPLSMLCAGNMMLRCGIAGSLMSLGAIDFGLIVDSSVVMVENCVRHLAEDKSDRSKLAIVRDAALEVRGPTMFGELIIMIVYLPILTLEGVEGKLFRPMALTVIFALTGSLVLSLTVIPALASLFLPRHVKHKQTLADRWAHAVFQPILRIALSHPWTTLSITAAATVATTILGLFIGAEFIPQLEEGALEINTIRLPGISLGESVRYGTQIEKLLLQEFPDEIETLWTRTGAAELAADPMGLEASDVIVMLKPPSEWKRAEDQEDLAKAIAAVLDRMPAMKVFIEQPIEARVEEMTVGIKGDVGIKLFGDDLEALKLKAREVEAALRKIPGAADAQTEQLTGQPVLEARVNADAIARYGVSRNDVLAILEAAAGTRVGEVREGQWRFPLVVRLSPEYRDDPEALDRIVVPTATGQRLPLTELVSFVKTVGPATITHDHGRRRIVVRCNVRGRDLAGFVDEAKAKIEPLITHPFDIGWGGQFEHYERARKRLYLVVPMALVLILSLLYLSFGSLRDSLMVFSGVLFARIGGVLGLWICRMPFSISAGIGFVALAGAAILEGLVLVSTIRRYMTRGLSKRDAIEQARLIRLRPVLMTGLVAALGFIPMAFSTGVGSEVQRPLATVIVFGIASDTVLTMLVLPVMYLLFGKESLPKSENGTAD